MVNKEKEFFKNMDFKSVMEISDYTEGLDTSAKDRIYKKCMQNMGIKNEINSDTYDINTDSGKTNETEAVIHHISESKKILRFISAAACIALVTGVIGFASSSGKNKSFLSKEPDVTGSETTISQKVYITSDSHSDRSGKTSEQTSSASAGTQTQYITSEVSETTENTAERKSSAVVTSLKKDDTDKPKLTEAPPESTASDYKQNVTEPAPVSSEITNKSETTVPDKTSTASETEITTEYLPETNPYDYWYDNGTGYSDYKIDTIDYDGDGVNDLVQHWMYYQLHDDGLKEFEKDTTIISLSTGDYAELTVDMKELEYTSSYHVYVIVKDNNIGKTYIGAFDKSSGDWVYTSRGHGTDLVYNADKGYYKINGEETDETEFFRVLDNLEILHNVGDITPYLDPFLPYRNSVHY